jgi:hypothetical protein
MAHVISSSLFPLFILLPLHLVSHGVILWLSYKMDMASMNILKKCIWQIFQYFPKEFLL